jgi:myosin heavy subunit
MTKFMSCIYIFLNLFIKYCSSYYCCNIKLGKPWLNIYWLCCDNRELCRVILSTCCPEAETNGDYQLGTTRVFLREWLERELERERARVVRAAAITMQKTVRGYLARRRYRATRKAALTLQAHVRGWAARKRYRSVRTGIVRVQANFRAMRQRKRYLELKVSECCVVMNMSGEWGFISETLNLVTIIEHSTK